ncbi:hypothetical protein TrST_g9285 [Triparma strigata]|uniref:WD40 repeat-like protein n=1 Tax=Triparma strigata TaxID=1606541 RepID=A0A9W7E650_9STRA|nr:hypothetical protein TrST_g9285 [Triparma strigata]
MKRHPQHYDIQPVPVPYSTLHQNPLFITGPPRKSLTLPFFETQFHLLSSPVIIAPHAPSPCSCVDTRDYANHQWLLSGGKDCAVALYDLKAAPPPPKSGDHTGRFLSRTQAREEELAQIEASKRRKPISLNTRNTGGHSHSLSAISFHPSDAGAFFSSDLSGRTLLWDTEHFIPVLESMKRGNVLTSSWMNDNAWMSSTLQGELVMFDAVSGTATMSLKGCKGPLNSFDCHPQHEHCVITGGTDGTVKLWDTRRSGTTKFIKAFSQDEVEETVLAPVDHRAHTSAGTAHRGSVNAVKFTPCGNFVVTLSGGSCATWDNRWARPRRLHEIERTKQTGSGRRVPMVLTGSTLSNVRVITPLQNLSKEIFSFYARPRPTENIVTMAGHLAPVSDFDISASNQMVSAGEDGMILAWGYREGRGRKVKARDEDKDQW